MLDLNDIALFVQVVRSGSFAEAARRLGVLSNTVSRRVQGLEQHLGTRLLQRSTRKLTLTSAGEEFNAGCAGAVAGLFEAGQDLSSGSQEPSGLVRFAAPADFLDMFVMEWVAEFLATYPRVRLALVLSDSKADLIADRIDVAFRGGPLDARTAARHGQIRHGAAERLDLAMHQSRSLVVAGWAGEGALHLSGCRTDQKAAADCIA